MIAQPDTAVREPLRWSALTLHALPPEERAWMLQALARDDADRLAPLLQELQALGIPRDASLLAELQAQGAAERTPPWPEVLDARALATLARVLRSEPDGIARKLLSMRAWSWTSALIADLPDTGRPRFETRQPRGARLEAALLESLRRQVEAEPTHTPVATPAAPSAWQRLRRFAVRTRSAE